jgi:hypothetical protein
MKATAIREKEERNLTSIENEGSNRAITPTNSHARQNIILLLFCIYILYQQTHLCKENSNYLLFNVLFHEQVHENNKFRFFGLITYYMLYHSYSMKIEEK